jgi:hypothetical protein
VDTQTELESGGVSGCLGRRLGGILSGSLGARDEAHHGENHQSAKENAKKLFHVLLLKN